MVRLGGLSGTTRGNRVYSIANRYRNNIARANCFSGYADNRVFNGLTGLTREGGRLSASRNTYMGLSNG